MKDELTDAKSSCCGAQIKTVYGWGMKTYQCRKCYKMCSPSRHKEETVGEDSEHICGIQQVNTLRKDQSATLCSKCMTVIAPEKTAQESNCKHPADVFCGQCDGVKDSSPSKFPPPQSPTEKWRKDFNEKYDFYEMFGDTSDTQEEIAAFITRTVKEAYSRGRSDEETLQVQDRFRLSMETQKLAASQARAERTKEIVEMVKPILEYNMGLCQDIADDADISLPFFTVESHAVVEGFRLVAGNIKESLNALISRLTEPKE